MQTLAIDDPEVQGVTIYVSGNKFCANRAAQHLLKDKEQEVNSIVQIKQMYDAWRHGKQPDICADFERNLADKLTKFGEEPSSVSRFSLSNCMAPYSYESLCISRVSDA